MANSGYVDERIVQMQFENQQFEKNANQSISTLDKLKKALNLDEAAKGFEELDNAVGKGIDLSAIQNGISAIGDKFSMMGILGITAMQRISNAAIDMGTKLGKTLLGLDGVSEGFSRYAEKSGHVKTIMTATGESIDHVSEVLDDLNWFTDETSYKFTDMVNTMGKFTSAGVKLDVAKEAVEGIALWAAESGQNAQTASRAMFQLAQAYGRGTIQLQDWMSVEQANMSTAKIQNELIKEGGKEAEAAIKKYGGFRDSLRSGWLTTETFNKVMQKYSEGVTEANYANGKFTQGVTEMSEAAFRNAQEARTYKDAIDAVQEAVQTGWSHSFEIIFGNAEESAIIWTDLANTLIEVADKFTAFRNDVLEVWSDLGGRDSMVNAAYNMFAGIGRIGNTIGKNFSEALHLSKTVEELREQAWADTEEGAELFEEYNKWFEALNRAKLNGASAEALEEIQTNLDDAFNSLNAMDRGNVLKSISDKFLEFSEVFKYVDDSIRIDKIKEIFGEVRKLEKLKGSLSIFDGSRKQAIQEQIESYYKEQQTLQNLSITYDAFKSTYETFLSILEIGKEVFDGVKNGLEPIISVLSKLIRPIASLITVVNEAITAVNKVISRSGIISSTLTGIGNTIANFLGPIVDFVSSRLYDIIEIIDEFTYNVEFGINPLKDLFDTTREKIDEFFAAINKNAISEKAAGIFDKIKTAFHEFLVFIKPVTDQIKKTFEQVFKDIKIAIKNLSLQDFLTGAGITGIVTFIGKLKDVIEKIKALIPGANKTKASGDGAKSFFSSIKEGIKDLMDTVKETANVAALVEMAAALGIITLSISRLSEIPAEDIAKALGAITEVFLELFGFLFAFNKMTKGSNTDFKAVGSDMLKIAASIYILGKAVENLAKIDGERLRNAVLAIGGMLLEIVAFKYLLDKTDNLNEGLKVDGIIKMAVGLLIMSVSLKKIGEMEWDQILKGLVGLGGVLLELAGFTWLINKAGGSDGIAEMGLGMILIATAMIIFGKAISSLGKMNLNELSQGLISMAVVLAEMVVTLGLLENTPTVKIATGMLILSAALTVLSGVLILLGKQKWQTLAKGLGTLALMVVVIGAVLAGMSDFTSGGHGLIAAAAAILIVAAALTVLTVPLMLLGNMNLGQICVALLAFAGVLAIMGVAAVLLGPAVGVLLGLAGAVALFGVGMLAFGAGLTLAAGSLVAFTTALVASISILAAGIGTIISAIVLALAEIGASLAVGIGAIGQALIEGITMLIEPVVNLVITLLESIAVALAEHAHIIIGAVADFLAGVIIAIAYKLPEIVDAAIQLAIAFVNGVAYGLINNADAIFEAIENLMAAILYFAVAALQELISTLIPFGDQVAGMLDGIKDTIKVEMDARQSKEIGTDYAAGLTSSLNEKTGDVNTAAANLADAGVEGVRSKVGDYEESGNEIVDTLLTTFGGHENELNLIGVDLGNSGAEGIKSTKGAFEDSANFTIDGFVNQAGSSYNLDRLYSVGVLGGQSYNDGFNSALDIGSPSKKMMWSAEMSILGFTKGVESNIPKVEVAAEKFGEATLGALSGTMAIVNRILNSSGDFNPVISPVLDLSDVRSGIGSVNTMMSKSRIGVTARAIDAAINMQSSSDNLGSKVDQLVDVAGKILGSVQNGSDLYLDDGRIAGRINRRLGAV